ncbi:aldo/keto reductase [Devosia sp. SD17-2]|jgi:aryl-alcohol dehydrogenase-like predicted oxidoreductase|uniref:aldo/keto reductase n=1 Tax=Devosia sp. SD17-2 TaxID=2976459 RepID=UPI0023D8AC89|nr:aldo/keto reductase [Devosia sp. SD17-2]WEJ33019.1 aldo/keto reductase [Devosia sp. SD17-2]
MNRRPLGRSEIVIEPLVLGGNVFGWTADEKKSFEILDAFLDEGFTAVDTAEGYPNWVEGNPPGMSETIIGNWMKARGNRDKVHLITKVNSGKPARGLSHEGIKQSVEASLKRLQTDYLDIYFSHWPDPTTEIEETLSAYDTLIRAGKVRTIGASNYNRAQMEEAIETSIVKSLPRYEVVQPLYNLYEREDFDALRPFLLEHDVGAIVYYSLAAGFLTGKYRSAEDKEGRIRGLKMDRFLNDKGFRILAAMDEVAAETGATLAEIALAWLVAQPGVSAPIASATSIEQVKSLAKGVRLELSEDAIARLTAAGA